MIHFSLVRSAILAACLAAANCAAVARPDAPLQLTGKGPYYQLNLPVTWQAFASRADLADVRIQNIQGEALPYAWVDTPDPVAVETQAKVALFKWSGPRPIAEKSKGVAAQPSPTSPSWPIWVMDLRKTSGRLQQLNLNLPDGQTGIFAVAVEASMDLQSWTTVQSSVQLAKLSHQGLVLHQEAIELGGISAAYLRLRLLPGSPEPVLGDATISTSEVAVSSPPWSWSGSVRAVRCSDQYCDYAVPSHVALGRIKVDLTEPNTVLSLRISGLPLEAGKGDTSMTRPHHHGLRNRLRTLRDKSHETNVRDAEPDDSAGWLWLNDAQVHWIEQDGKQIRSQELPLDNGVYRMLRLRTASGDNGWTRHPPAIELGTWQRSLVFLARGSQPYRLTWASPQAAAVALPMTQLRPDAHQGGLGAPGLAMLPPAPVTLAGPGADAALSMPSALAASSALEAGDPVSRIPGAWWLWAAMLLGLGLMVYMVRALLLPSADHGGSSDQRRPEA